MITSSKYQNDTQSELTFATPLILIEKEINGELISKGISTQQLNFKDKQDNNLYYEPLLLSIPTISEKINIENKKYNIGRMSLNISNARIGLYRYSDQYKNLLNANVTFYFKTQSANNLDECLQVYTGKVLRITHDENTIKISIEDSSQEKLTKEIPFNLLDDNGSIVPKYRNKPIPVCYGRVDKSPCVIKGRDIIFESQDVTGIMKTQTDQIFQNITKNALYVHDGSESYGNVLLNIDTVIEGSFDKEGDNPYKIQSQWYEKQDLNGFNTIIKLYETELLKRNGIQVRVINKPSNPEMVRYEENLINEDTLGLEEGQVVNIIDSDSIYTDVIEPIENLTDNDYRTKLILLDHPEYLIGASDYDIDWNLQLTENFKYYELRISPIVMKDLDIVHQPKLAINAQHLPTPIPVDETQSGLNLAILGYAIRNQNVSNYLDEITGEVFDLSKLFLFDDPNLASSIDVFYDYDESVDIVGEEGLDQKGVDIAFKDMTSQASTAGATLLSKGDVIHLYFSATSIQGYALVEGNLYQGDIVARFKQFDTTYLGDYRNPLTANYYVDLAGRKDEQSGFLYFENLTFYAKKDWFKADGTYDSYGLYLNDSMIDYINFAGRLKDSSNGIYFDNNGIEMIRTRIELEDPGGVVIDLYPDNMNISTSDINNNDDILKISMNARYEYYSGSDGDFYTMFDGEVMIKFYNGDEVTFINPQPTNEENFRFLYAHTLNGDDSVSWQNLPPITNAGFIIKDILEKESNVINIDEASLNMIAEEHIDWQFAFTQNKLIKTKDLIEDFCRSTKSFVRFRGSDNNFIFTTMKDEYVVTNINRLITSTDVIKYNFSRSKTEDIVTKVSVLYKPDYAKENVYLNKTPYITTDDLLPIDINIPQYENETHYNYDYYSIDSSHKDTTLDFKSKYIRNEDTAIKLRNRLLSYNLNAHNIIDIILGLNYMNLEVGDIIAFDKEINDLKCNGEPYAFNEAIYRNGQEIYPYFLITETKKTIRDIRLKAIQLHKYDDSLYADILPEDVDKMPIRPGDVNLDGIIDINDFTLLVAYIRQEFPLPEEGTDLFTALDVNGDGSINFFDALEFVNLYF